MRIKGNAVVAPYVGALRTPEVHSAPLMRTCPICEAKPGYSCVRFTGARLRGQPTDGGYMRRLKNPHRER